MHMTCPVCERPNVEMYQSWSCEEGEKDKLSDTCPECGAIVTRVNYSATMKRRIIHLVKNDKKIAAIKEYRRFTGEGLRESKEFVEKLMEVQSFLD